MFDGSQSPAIPSGNDWTGIQLGNGIAEVICKNWPGFNEFITSVITQIHSNVFRGQALSSWELRPTLDRAVDSFELGDNILGRVIAYHELRKKHLDNFKYASRGRRVTGAAHDISDDHWWALGQHYGLATPLIDWTESPYVAAFFALNEASHGEDGYATVYSLNRHLIEKRVKEFNQENGRDQSMRELIRFISPLAEDNARLINQRGLFTISPDKMCLVEVIKRLFLGRSEAPLLIIKVPRSERRLALRQLNRMNVSSLTLFPDLQGASAYCNMSLQDRLY